VRTEPPMHTAVKKGTVVDIALSKGPELFLVPGVANKSIDEAKADMSAVGFTLTVGDEQYSDTVPKGDVASVTPDVDKAKRGTAFVAIVSKGPPPVPVPDVQGKTADQARSALNDAGLTYSPIEQYSDTVDVGVVIGSDPAGGATAPKG